MKTKLLIAAISICLLTPQVSHGGRGGAVAGGLFGGYLLGSAMASASQPRERVVYVDNTPSRSRESDREYDLRRKERELEKKERELEEQERKLQRQHSKRKTVQEKNALADEDLDIED
ncbi:MAG: hypothetical protein WC707_00110 [Candidatus Babeliaceae bacterium]|jgi:hypothetical protein